MVLIDSVFIHTGGGLTILKLLVNNLRGENVFFLFDHRLNINDLPNSNHLNYITINGYIDRYKFYKKNTNFKTVLCLSNVPPPIKLQCKTITFLHSDLYISKPILKGFKNIIIQKIKTHIFRHTLKNTDYLIVQTSIVKNNFLKQNNFPVENIYIYPIFDYIDKNDQIKKNEDLYLYVSDGNFHKNHKRLIDAFVKFSLGNEQKKLFLTINEKEHAQIIEYLHSVNTNSIKNLGFISKKELAEYYKNCQYLIFPSLQESFGLGIIEGIMYECKIIASDLDYVHELCTPSLTFDPYDTNSIYEALVASKNLPSPKSNLLIENHLTDFINTLL